MRGSEDVPHRIIAPEALLEVTRLRTPKSGVLGWGPALLARFGYHTPDEWYEAALTSLVREDTDWLDVGCGWRLLPQNQRLAQLLAARCRFVAGVDPDPSIERNPLLDEKHRCRLEDLDTERRYSLISLRMVAEHIANPDAAIAALGRLATDGGLVVVYTVHKWAPVSLAAAATPMWLHHLAKRLLWGANPSDTFPTVFKLNTRKRLARIFGAYGFREESYSLLDDCRTFQRWKICLRTELSLWRVLRAAGLRYPEVCILGVYRRVVAAEGSSPVGRSTVVDQNLSTPADKYEPGAAFEAN